MLILDEIESRRSEIDASADLSALRDHLGTRAWPLIERMPVIPARKALLSRDGGSCPDDGAPLVFDPWSPAEHRCPVCGRVFAGPRHDAHWARMQHLWVAERSAHLATMHLVAETGGAAARARELLAGYYDLYHQLPNRGNVLGPSHLFFSTYLESIWILNYLAAAFMLREVDALDDGDLKAIDAIADEAATIIAEFNEGMSNRQTWNSAALAAIAAWFGDEDLAVHAIEGRTGLLGHLADGFGADGMWFEGENYHLFAMRGLLIGLQWARIASADLLSDDRAAEHLSRALMAPADTSLPDRTFPARKDSRYGVSLAHPAYLECWEAGHAWLGSRERADLPGWLDTLYQTPVRTELTYDAYLHDAAQPLPAARDRGMLSWWALWMMAPALPASPAPWAGQSRLMEQQGLGVIRHGTSYWSLECGGGGTGHGHPDRLQLSAHVDGIPWLTDPGTGSYVHRDLFWYRSTMAHNAPLIDGADQPADARSRCDAFDAIDDWTWASAASGSTHRALVVGPRWTVDLLRHDVVAAEQVDLPWHLAGDLTVDSAGDWRPLDEATEYVTDVMQFVPASTDPVRVTARCGDRTLTLWLLGDGDLIRAVGPGLPGETVRRPFVMRRARGTRTTMVTVIDPAGTVTAVRWQNGSVSVTDGDGISTLDVAHTGATIARGTWRLALAGAQPVPIPPMVNPESPPVTRGRAIRVSEPPALDGSLIGFRRGAPLVMNEEYHYFRSEQPYAGPDEFSAVAYVNWLNDALYLAVDIHKSDLVLRDDAAPPLALDNEPEDINADGVQVYLISTDHRLHAWLIRPAPDGGLAMRSIDSDADTAALAGHWQRTPTGYRITAQIRCTGTDAWHAGDRIPFDILVNEMHDGDVRRNGQLVWSGGPGWVYLRGDRHAPANFGELELVG